MADVEVVVTLAYPVPIPAVSVVEMMVVGTVMVVNTVLVLVIEVGKTVTVVVEVEILGTVTVVVLAALSNITRLRTAPTTSMATINMPIGAKLDTALLRTDSCANELLLSVIGERQRFFYLKEGFVSRGDLVQLCDRREAPHM